MRYVDAGYVIALSVLALYALSLFVRRRRLERAATRGVTRGHDAVRVDGPTGSSVPSVREPRR